MIKLEIRKSFTCMLVALGMCGGPVAFAGELHDAVKAGDINRVQALLAGGADVNEPDLDGNALHMAVGMGSEEMIKALLDGGANLEVAGEPAGAHPLHLATQLNITGVAELLLAHGANVDALDSQGRTPLMLAALNNLRGVVGVLLSHGADVRIQDSIYGETALHMASFAGDPEIVSQLLSKGAEVNARSGLSNQTPLFSAGHHGHVEVVKILLSAGAELNAKDKDGANATKWAVSPAKEYLISLGLNE